MPNKKRVVETSRLPDSFDLLAGSDIAVVVLDSGLHVRRYTSAAGSLLNLTPADVGRPFTAVASNLKVIDWDTLFAELTASAGQIVREVEDRTGRCYLMRMRPYGTGTDSGVLIVLFDVDVMKRALDEARESHDLVTAILECVHGSLVALDSDFRVRAVNGTFCEMFGVDRSTVEGQPFFSILEGQWNVPELRDRLREVVPKRQPIQLLELDHEFPKIGRRRLLVNARPIVRDGQGPDMIVIALDITKQKQTEEALQKSEAAIRELLRSAPQSIIAVDANGTIVLANGSTAEVFGYDQDDLLGKPLGILLPEALQARHAQHLGHYFAKMQSRPMGIGLDLAARRKDGTTFPVEIALSAIETAQGQFAVAFVSDITGRKRLEREAQVQAEQVRALAAGLLTAQEEERRRVSRELHDQICQQLASLAMDIGGLAAETPLPPGMQDRVKGLQSRVVKASEEARHIAYQLHPSVLDDLGLVFALRGLCKDLSDRHGFAVEFIGGDLPRSVPREVAACLYRVAQEGLQNIAQHSHAKHVMVKLSFRDGVLALSLEDDGVGFEFEDAKARGGLGLIGMEERVRLIRGKLSITAQPGRGTRIALQVPSGRNTV